jgi:hypothetical protein
MQIGSQWDRKKITNGNYKTKKLKELKEKKKGHGWIW